MKRRTAISQQCQMHTRIADIGLTKANDRKVRTPAIAH